METYGDATYTYLASGELATKTVPGTGTTTYAYDELGSLTSVELPNGDDVDYNVDGLGRRVTRKLNGTVTNRFQYGTGLQPIVELDASGGTVSTFVYASKGNVPDYMTKGGVNYRFVTDNVGSVRMVVDAFTGAIAQRIDYDSFGNVLNDTNPGFQPFAFAGGLYDAATGLTRFGARDYEAANGRWTAKDPLLILGGSTNFYAYAASDPVNLIDPTGLVFSSIRAAFGGVGEAFHGFMSGIGNALSGLVTGAVCLADDLTSAVAQWDGWGIVRNVGACFLSPLCWEKIEVTAMNALLPVIVVAGGVAIMGTAVVVCASTWEVTAGASCVAAAQVVGSVGFALWKGVPAIFKKMWSGETFRQIWEH